MRGQAGLDAMVSSAALLAFIAALVWATGEATAEGRGVMGAARAQALADASALSVNLRAVDSAFTSLGAFSLPGGCLAANGSVWCGNSSGSSRIWGGTWWDGYGSFNRIPV